MDMNQLMQLANNPQVRQMLQSLFSQFAAGGKGAGGSSGLLDQLSNSGLQKQVQSWVGTGDNQAVTAQQLEQALGPQLDQAAAQAGTTPHAAAGELAAVLPQLVDQASPQGKLPDAQQLQDLFGKLMRPSAA